jgi:hypothetical protein
MDQNENDMMTRVGPGTPAGETLRRYWLPVSFSHEIKSDEPKIVRRLSEDLLIFRDRHGPVEGIAAVGAGTDPAAWLASSPNKNAAKVFLNWILSREGQNQFQKLTRENSLRVDIPKEGIVNPYYILDPKKEYLFTGLEEHKDKINEFRPWLEALVKK